MSASRITVLMYHAILDGQGRCESADPHYAVGREAFRAQLEAIAAAGARAASVAELLEAQADAPRVAVTFDDGHESNAEAAREIAARSGSADLFVNPARVGERHYLGWSDLADLAAAGISIQSHGQSHRYLDELAPAEVEHELAASKAEIEAKIARPVTLFAPPGGRLAPRLAETARALGYRGLCTSHVGLWRHGGSPWDIPRFAVLATTGPQQFARWIRQDGWEVARLGLRQRVLDGAKRALGNRRYERLRSRLLGETDAARHP